MSDYYHIKGVGIDIVEISRITDMLQSSATTFENIFTKNEISQCLADENSFTAFALRYAAKQAIVKSLGTRGKLIPLNQIDITRVDKGPAMANLNKYWYQKFSPDQKLVINLSLSSYADFAVAQATVYNRKFLKGRMCRKTLTPIQATRKA